MEIRSATTEDIPSIISLLKISLGETLMPKSEAFWKWKHVNNPFGQSPVIIAFEGEKLIGVRAFMRWDWIHDGHIYKTVRAVDTATHPDYQGKGIFKYLTMRLVYNCKEEGIQFIYNTPNSISKPGYLKMGWNELGKLKVRIRPVMNFRSRQQDFDQRYAWSVLDLESILSLTRDSENLITTKSAKYYQWRYGDNPNIRYYKVGSEHLGFLLIFRLKPYRFGSEFRIVDCLMTKGSSHKDFKSVLFTVVKESGANVITYAGELLPFKSIGFDAGPSVTFRSLNYSNSLTFDFWKPTLGDMEVF